MTRRGKRRLALLLGSIVLVVGLGLGALAVRRSLGAAEVERAGREGLALFAEAEAKSEQAELGTPGAAREARAAYRKAAPLLRKYCEQNRTDGEALWALAISQYNTVRPNGRHLLQASGTLRTIVATPLSGPDAEKIRIDAYEQLVTIYGEVGYIPELREAADDLLAIDPGNILAVSAKAESFLVLGDIDRARELAAELNDTHPDRLRTFSLRNDLLRRSADADDEGWAELASDISAAIEGAQSDELFEMTLLLAQVEYRLWRGLDMPSDIEQLQQLYDAAIAASALRPENADLAEFYTGWVEELRADIKAFGTRLDDPDPIDGTLSSEEQKERDRRAALRRTVEAKAAGLADAAAEFEQRVLQDPVLGQQLAMRFVARAWWAVEDGRARDLIEQIPPSEDPEIEGWRHLLIGEVIEPGEEDDGPNAWETITAAAVALGDSEGGDASAALGLLDDASAPGTDDDAADMIAYFRAEALRRLGAFDDAERALLDLSLMRQRPARVQVTLARLYLANGRPIDAVDALTASDTPLPNRFDALELEVTDAALTEADPTLFSMDPFDRDRLLTERTLRVYAMQKALEESGAEEASGSVSLADIRPRFARASILLGEHDSIQTVQGLSNVLLGLKTAKEIADAGEGPAEAIALLLPVAKRYAFLTFHDKDNKDTGVPILGDTDLDRLIAIAGGTTDPVTEAHRLAQEQGPDAATAMLRDRIAAAADPDTELDARIALVEFGNQTANAGDLDAVRELSDRFPDSARAQRTALDARIAWQAQDGGRDWPGEEVVKAAVTRLGVIMGKDRTAVQVYSARAAVRELSGDVERLARDLAAGEDSGARLRELRPRLNAIILQLDDITDAAPDGFWGHYVESLAYRVSHRLTELERAQNPEVGPKPDLPNAANALARAVATGDRLAVTAYPELIQLLRDLGQPGEVDRRLNDFLSTSGLPTALVRSRAALLEENGRLRDALRDRLDLVDRPRVLMQDQIALAALYGLTGEVERGQSVLEAQLDVLSDAEGVSTDDRATMMVSIANAFAACDALDDARAVLADLPERWAGGSRSATLAAFELRHGDVGDAADQLVAAARQGDDLRAWLDAIRALATAGRFGDVEALIATAPPSVREHPDVRAVESGLSLIHEGETPPDPDADGIRPIAAIALAMVAVPEGSGIQTLLRDRALGTADGEAFARDLDEAMRNRTQAPYTLHRVLIEQYAANEASEDRARAAKRAVARVPADPRPLRDLIDALIVLASEFETEAGLTSDPAAQRDLQTRARGLWSEAEQFTATLASLPSTDPFETSAYQGIIAVRRGNPELAMTVLSDHATELETGSGALANGATVSLVAAAAATDRTDEITDPLFDALLEQASAEETILTALAACRATPDLDRRRDWLQRIDTKVEDPDWILAMTAKVVEADADKGLKGYDPVYEVLRARVAMWYALAETTGSEPDVTRAQRARATLDRERPGTRVSRVVSGMLAELSGDHQSAREAYEAYLDEINGADPGIAASLAVLLATQLGELDEAERVADAAIQRVEGASRRNPRLRALAYHARAVVHLRRGQTEAAKSLLDRALDAQVQFVPALLTLAELHLADGDKQAAIGALDRMPDVQDLNAKERATARDLRARAEG